jgi:hypothetical protein
MTKAKRILITTECREIYIVRCVGNRAIRCYCETCAAETEMLTLDEAVIAANKTTRELIRRIESGAAHSIETASGYLLVCAASLLENGNSSKSG